jgi:hypothetical protein
LFWGLARAAIVCPPRARSTKEPLDGHELAMSDRALGRDVRFDPPSIVSGSICSNSTVVDGHRWTNAGIIFTLAS